MTGSECVINSYMTKTTVLLTQPLPELVPSGFPQMCTKLSPKIGNSPSLCQRFMTLLTHSSEHILVLQRPRHIWRLYTHVSESWWKFG